MSRNNNTHYCLFFEYVNPDIMRLGKLDLVKVYEPENWKFLDFVTIKMDFGTLVHS